MSSALAGKMRKAREFRLEIGGLSLRLRRPTQAEYARMARANATFLEFAEEFVIDWGVMKESDLIPSGGDLEVPFDRELWVEFLADRHDLWEPIAKAVSDAFFRHVEEREEREKN